MTKFLAIVIIVALVPAISTAEDMQISSAKNLLTKITELQVFKLRLPHKFQREVRAELQKDSPNTIPLETCTLQAKPHHRGAGIEYVCDSKGSIKKELAAIAAN